ncbi:putative sugar nucleotidyl transferase [Aporhodopirellula aestuarii]|uniref:Glucose-1-phosphate thymidylyltransferase n=1 Tax=Aporhodopirellula aestuarii TaxID=2950107 RepID=A0ABT0U908_9BACT|nr:putative sugar nucleotidyl transferase [Aporhodopirellula aestuarii]MCM2373266.1 glucose-1-phosphate thymidylyltransferase [Aporhodopirellula aestuarii]
MLIYCFEDERVEKLAPIVHARPAYAISCAGYRLIDWLDSLRRETAETELVAEVRDYLRVIQKADYSVGDIPETLASPNTAEADRPDVLLVNARLIPSVQNLRILQQLVRSNQFSVVMSGSEDQETDVEPDNPIARDSSEAVLAAWVPAAEVTKAFRRAEAAKNPVKNAAQSTDSPTPARTKASREKASVPARVYQILCRHAASTASRSSARASEFCWPHDVVAAHMGCMVDSIEYRIAAGSYTQLQDGVFVGENVSIGDYESIHTDGGAIVLDDNVNVGPFCFLEGPLYAGRNTRVIEHSSIKDGVSLGHTTKIGGEVEASVIEPYTNKQHHGFLGHSYLGSWINLGAGTCNSDLKNTYGKINIQYGNEKVATGMQFLGCIMGDYSKSAINTGIFTGKVVGVCSMMYGFVTGNVPSYVNYARLFGQTSLLPPEVMVNTQARMFARRKVKQRQADIDLIHAMYHLTESERQLSDQLGF